MIGERATYRGEAPTANREGDASPEIGADRSPVVSLIGCRFARYGPSVNPLCRRACARIRWRLHEEDVPTEQASPSPQARLSQAYANPRRSRRGAVAPVEGPQAPVGLTGRLRSTADFARVREHGRTVRSGPLRLRFVATDRPEPRVAYAVSKAVGTAVVRNRLRRQLRAIFDGPTGALLPTGDYLVSVRPEAVGSSAKDLNEYVLAATNNLRSEG